MAASPTTAATSKTVRIGRVACDTCGWTTRLFVRDSRITNIPCPQCAAVVHCG